MLWQDMVLTIVSIIFSLSLVPQIYQGFKEKIGPIRYQTSVPTFLGLFVITGVYLTLHLYFSAAMSFFTGVAWFLLCLQRMTYTKKTTDT